MARYIPGNERVRNSDDFKVISNIMHKFNNIEEKNRCLRVRFLDWLSDKLFAWSKKTKAMSDRIQSPCSIKI
jgi:hypothetical protein